MSADEPTVGVVIPARNAAEYLAEALESVLSQGDGVTDVVVVDDGSEDETAAVARRVGPRIAYVRQDPLGPAAARNRGVRSLSTELVAFLDADDLWTDGSLQARLEVIRTQPDIGGVFGHMEQFVSDRLSEQERRRLAFDPRPQPGWASGAMLARRELFERIGPFPEHRRGGDFIEWFLAARRAGVEFAMVDTVVLRRRLHDRNLSRLEPQINYDYLRIVRAELTRRRAEAAGEATDPAPSDGR